MKFGIQGRHIELTAALLAHVERRLRFALSRFGQKIRLAAVQLADLNGPRGGLDKQCRVRGHPLSVGEADGGGNRG